MHKINNFHLRFDIWYNLFQTCYYYILVNCCQVHAYIASNGGEKKKKTQVVNQFLLLVTYHIILSIEISVLIHYILGWVGCFF